MKSQQLVYFSRDDQHLVILPKIPKWFVVSTIALELLLKMVVKRQTIAKILEGVAEGQREEIHETCAALQALINQPGEEGQAEISRPITAKTTVAMIAVTEQCNLRCSHCYVDATSGIEKVSGQELTLDEHERIAEALAVRLATNTGVRYGVNLTGGEPFSHSEISQIIRTYYRVGFEVGASTNGLLISKKHLGVIMDCKVVLSVSLDGCSASTHEAIRGINTFRSVKRHIKELTEAGVRVGINFLLHEGNFHELEGTIGLAYDMGCSGFNPINLVQIGRACGSDLRRVSETVAFRRIATHLEKHPEHQPLFARTSMFSSLGAAILAGITCASCGVGNRPCVYIDAGGNVYPCANTQKPEFRLGNVRTSTLEECLKDEHPVMDKLRGLNIDRLNPSCSICSVRKFCGGDCRGETYNVTGDLHAPYVACADRFQSLLELMWIISDQPNLFAERAREYIENADRGV